MFPHHEILQPLRPKLDCNVNELSTCFVNGSPDPRHCRIRKSYQVEPSRPLSSQVLVCSVPSRGRAIKAGVFTLGDNIKEGQYQASRSRGQYDQSASFRFVLFNEAQGKQRKKRSLKPEARRYSGCYEREILGPPNVYKKGSSLRAMMLFFLLIIIQLHF